MTHMPAKPSLLLHTYGRKNRDVDQFFDAVANMTCFPCASII